MARFSSGNLHPSDDMILRSRFSCSDSPDHGFINLTESAASSSPLPSIEADEDSRWSPGLKAVHSARALERAVHSKPPLVC